MSLFHRLGTAAHQISSEISSHLTPGVFHSHTHASGTCSTGTHVSENRYDSFAPQRDGNSVKWYVDGCGYFWAVSEALERAEKSVWILDWWLSPELYLRRPPSENEQYRLDRMLFAAAKRGVKINIIVYKEVAQALTRKFLNPALPDYLHAQLPASTGGMWKSLARAGLDATFKSLEFVEANFPLIVAPVAVNSEYTKHVLEGLHENIAVFRHPDHLPEKDAWESSLRTSMRNMRLGDIAKIPEDLLKAFRGSYEDTVLYWAHHEKLCIVDGKLAFMGGLDLCFGRWDTNQHSIADAHPGNLDLVVFPGQDYNNARIMDFQSVNNWQNNRLDRRTNSRMGWSDLSFSLTGLVVDDLRTHFAQRWNFIYDEKYRAIDKSRYGRLDIPIFHEYAGGHRYQHHGRIRDEVRDRLKDHIKDIESGLGYGRDHSQPFEASTGGVNCQIVRSCARWSHGVDLEHSIANAYIEIIKNSQHFIYLENQFFITATADTQQNPVANKIGAAIVERILRAASNGERYRIIVCIPALPGFAGDLRSDESSSARAVLMFQYKSICRGPYSIFETLRREQVNPEDYITFYNLRNYDRINSSAIMEESEQRSGVSYEDARQEQDDILGAGYGGNGENTGATRGEANLLHRYKQAAAQVLEQSQRNQVGRWDSVAECYMLNGADIRTVPWHASDTATAEIDAFVSEELYIHTKLLIADDRVVICGSANLNDRSQLGNHDSEIAIVIEDSEYVESTMAGQPWRASKFAASLRRQLFRKHLGLIPAQNMKQPQDNFHPVDMAPNSYDWGSLEDRAVVDPLSPDFLNRWTSTARTNTAAFAKVFHPIPDDRVRTWADYQQFYERYFPERTKGEEKKDLYRWGHVVREEFSSGPDGVDEVKEVLSRIRGTLVEMPMHFLEDEVIVKEGMSLNYFTDEVYT